MSLFNPYDEYEQSENSAVEQALDLLGDIGIAAWLLPLSPIGLLASGIAWLMWGGTFLLVLSIVGLATLLLGLVLAGISLIRFLVQERTKDQPSALTVKLFTIAGISLIVSSLAGLMSVAYCLHRLLN